MGKTVLLVEGPDDEHVVKHLCGNCEGPKLDEVVPHGGASRLLESFGVRLLESDTEALGVVIDADTNLASRWTSLRGRLENAGYEAVPDSPESGGTIVSPPEDSLLPRVGVWIMPDNQAAGILEDFLCFLVPGHSALFEHAESSVDAVPKEERRFPEVRRTKALLHTWLAWQKEPGKPLGQAITARYLDPDLPQAGQFVGWMNRLFAPSVLA